MNTTCLVLRQTGRTAEAVKTYERAIAILESLIRSDPRTEYLADLAICQVNLGQIYRQLDRRTEALEIYHRAASTRERLAKTYPSITSFQVQLANVYNSLGNVLEELNRPADSIQAMERAAEIYEPLVKANPTVTMLAQNQATILTNLGMFQRQAGHLDPARASYQRALAITQQLVKEHPTVPDFQMKYGHAAAGLAAVRALEGDLAGAIRDFREASRVLEGIRNPWPKDVFQLAGVHAQLGRLLKEAPAAERPDPRDAPERHFEAAIALIRQAITGGFGNLYELNAEPDFDPLRSRPDFQLLHMDLAFPARAFAPN